MSSIGPVSWILSLVLLLFGFASMLIGVSGKTLEDPMVAKTPRGAQPRAAFLPVSKGRSRALRWRQRRRPGIEASAPATNVEDSADNAGKTLNDPWWRRLTGTGRVSIALWFVTLILAIGQKCAEQDEASAAKQTADKAIATTRAEDRLQIERLTGRVNQLNTRLDASVVASDNCNSTLAKTNMALAGAQAQLEGLRTRAESLLGVIEHNDQHTRDAASRLQTEIDNLPAQPWIVTQLTNTFAVFKNEIGPRLLSHTDIETGTERGVANFIRKEEFELRLVTSLRRACPSHASNPAAVTAASAQVAPTTSASANPADGASSAVAPSASASASHGTGGAPP